MTSDKISIFDLLYEPYKIITIEEVNNAKLKVYADGKIETCDFKFLRKNGRKMNRKGRVLKPATDKDGYYRVVIAYNNVKRTYHAHRLVARAYLPNYSNDLQVNHKNGIKTDNRVDNLEMVSLQENIAHSIRTGLKPKLIRDEKGRFKGKEVLPNE